MVICNRGARGSRAPRPRRAVVATATGGRRACASRARARARLWRPRRSRRCRRRVAGLTRLAGARRCGCRHRAQRAGGELASRAGRRPGAAAAGSLAAGAGRRAARRDRGADRGRGATRWWANGLARCRPTQARALRAGVLDERDYADIAVESRCSEAVLRKRVSRGWVGCADALRGGCMIRLPSSATSSWPRCRSTRWRGGGCVGRWCRPSCCWSQRRSPSARWRPPGGPDRQPDQAAPWPDHSRAPSRCWGDRAGERAAVAGHARPGRRDAVRHARPRNHARRGVRATRPRGRRRARCVGPGRRGRERSSL